MTSRAAFVAIASLVLLTGMAAEGWGADKATESSGGAAVSGLITDAVAEYDAGRFEEARALFRLAHERAPTARTLRGIGMASFELRDYVEAARTLAAALRETRRPLTEEQKRQVESLLARAEAFIGRFSLRLQPAGMSIAVDGRTVEREADGTLLLPFGRHRLVARCPFCTPTERELNLDVSGGERRDIDITLAQASEAPPTAATGSSVAPASGTPTIVETSAAADVPGPKHLWFAGGAVAAAVGAGLGAWWWIDRQGEIDACRAAVTTGDLCQNESTLKDERGLAAGLTLGLGAAAIAAGVVAAVIWPRQDQPATSAWACVPGKETVSCAIRF